MTYELITFDPPRMRHVHLRLSSDSSQPLSHMEPGAPPSPARDKGGASGSGTAAGPWAGVDAGGAPAAAAAAQPCYVSREEFANTLTELARGVSVLKWSKKAGAAVSVTLRLRVPTSPLPPPVRSRL